MSSRARATPATIPGPLESRPQRRRCHHASPCGRPSRPRRTVPKRALALLAALALSLGLVQLAPSTADPAEAQETAACDVQFDTTESEAGFTDPGVGLTEPIIQNARDQIAAGQEPWTSGLAAMKRSSAAGVNVTSSNAGTDPTKPRSDAFDSQGFNSRFIADGLKAYTQSVLFVLTGEEVYRENALAIIRIWEQMDPEKYVYFTDSHIHTGHPAQPHGRRRRTAALHRLRCGRGTPLDRRGHRGVHREPRQALHRDLHDPPPTTS